MIFNLIDSHIAQNACNKIMELPHDGSLCVIIEEKTKAKTIAQRNHFHSCVRVLANHCGYSEREMKCLIVEEVRGLDEVINKKTGRAIAVLPSTEELIKKHYGELIDYVYELAGKLHVRLPTVYDRG